MTLSIGDLVPMTISSAEQSRCYGTAGGLLGFIDEDEWCWERPVLPSDCPQVGDTVPVVIQSTNPEIVRYRHYRTSLGGRPVRFSASIRATQPPPAEPAFAVGSDQERNLLLRIEDLELSVRTRTILRKKHIDTVAELASHSQDELLNYKGLGQTTIQEIRPILAKLGLHLWGESLDRALASEDSHRIAVEFFARGLAVSKQMATSDPTNAQAQHGLSLSYENFAGALRNAGEFAQALAFHGEALAIRERLARDHPDVPDFAGDVGVSLGNMAGVDRAMPIRGSSGQAPARRDRAEEGTGGEPRPSDLFPPPR